MWADSPDCPPPPLHLPLLRCSSISIIFLLSSTFCLLYSTFLSTVVPNCKELRWLLSNICSELRRSFFFRCSSIRPSTRHSLNNSCGREGEGRREEGGQGQKERRGRWREGRNRVHHSIHFHLKIRVGNVSLDSLSTGGVPGWAASNGISICSPFPYGD